MKRSSLEDRYCAVARSTSELMDGWTFMILREIMLRNRKFDGMLAQTGMSPRSLTLRLKHLIDAEILEKIPYQEGPVRYEYNLTQKGQEIWPILIALKQWGEKWKGPWKDDEKPLRIMHKGHGHELIMKFVCAECDEEVDAFSSSVEISQNMQSEREYMADLHDKKKQKLAG